MVELVKGFSDITFLEKKTAASAPNTPGKEYISGSEPESGTESKSDYFESAEYQFLQPSW